MYYWITLLPSVFFGLLAAYFAIRSRQVAALEVIKTQNMSVVSIFEEVREEVKIYFAEVPVVDLSKIQIILKNSGTLPIKYDDVIEPMTFSIPEEASFLKWYISEKKPQGLQIDLTRTENNKILCEFKLLNQGDEATINFLCGDNRKGDLVTNGRIKGVKTIKDLDISLKRAGVFNVSDLAYNKSRVIAVCAYEGIFFTVLSGIIYGVERAPWAFMVTIVGLFFMGLAYILFRRYIYIYRLLTFKELVRVIFWH